MTSCVPNYNKTETNSVNQINTENPKNKDFFDNPSEMCTILSENGIGELKQWSNPMDMGWGSMTDYYQFGNSKDGVVSQNNISYYLEGTETAVNSLTVTLNINNSADKKDALLFFADITEKTFSSLKIEFPPELKKSILRSKKYKNEVSQYLVSNELEKSRIESWKVTLKRKELN